MSQDNITNMKPIKTSFFQEMAWKDKGKFVELDSKKDLRFSFKNGKWSQFTAQWKSMYFIQHMQDLDLVTSNTNLSSELFNV